MSRYASMCDTFKDQFIVLAAILLIVGVGISCTTDHVTTPSPQATELRNAGLVVHRSFGQFRLQILDLGNFEINSPQRISYNLLTLPYPSVIVLVLEFNEAVSCNEIGNELLEKHTVRLSILDPKSNRMAAFDSELQEIEWDSPIGDVIRSRYILSKNSCVGRLGNMPENISPLGIYRVQFDHRPNEFNLSVIRSRLLLARLYGG